jgi:c-di-GMP-binding flagellar brake protein YcgR
VHVVAPSGATADARVKDAGDEGYLLRLDHGASREHFTYDAVSLEFANMRGVCRLVGTAEEASDPGVLRVHSTGAIELIQRRDFVRVEVYVPVTYMPDGPEGRTVQANTLEIGGGGFRLVDAAALRGGDMLRFTLELGEGEDPFHAVAVVVREAGDGSVGLKFVDLPDRDRDRLVRWLFARERLARRMARGS